MNQVYTKGVNGELMTYSSLNITEILNDYHLQTGIPLEYLRASQKSKPIKNIDVNATVYISLKIQGGKGGFGSLLRGQGMIARVDNFDACRDLNGRRIRDINNEIKLADWRAKEQKKKELAKEEVTVDTKEVVLPQKRNAPVDSKHLQDVKECIQGVKSALAQGLKKLKKIK